MDFLPSWSMQSGLLLLFVALASLAFIIQDLLKLLLRQYVSPLRNLRGPPVSSRLFGNLKEMYNQENTGLLADWEATYGQVYAYKGFFGGSRLMVTDLNALSYILGEPDLYQKPRFVRDNLAAMGAGHEGLLTVEGDTHRRQGPAFGGPQIRTLYPVIWQKAYQLKMIWLDKITNNGDKESCEVDVLYWLSRVALDIIGLAGFGYSFNALTEPNNVLSEAYAAIFSNARKLQSRTIFESWIPLLRKFRHESSEEKEAQAIVNRIGNELIEQRRLDSLEQASNTQSSKSTNKDLLSILVQSNLAASVNQGMTLPEVMCQISTFLIAGHETTASALTWCMYALAKSPASQRALRRALQTISPESETLDDEVDRLPYLDWVVRESLRLHAPITWTMRAAMSDDEIPVQQPYLDKHGRERTSISLKKHDIITIPIQAINKSKVLWGEDTLTFRPERWEHPPEKIKMIHGLYSNTMTFLTGQRSCIGYRLALAEIKILLYVLVRDIEVSIDPTISIDKTFSIVARPSVQPDRSRNTMPLLLRAVQAVQQP
ncbi:cytochrome P450 [Coniophora puteana RWD-64-598 SS2]|uniref:Cytochrome P450 n=1 Tax=Coniophora puteana (strain RWD-64-598) TaxID=741705 RepID=A0A5M3MQB3_CONPW|nr:cytochrome P450 [Coniophora puteana RWD-64-598 SS2]EIW81246.1 cytochrome P450 [Coniophora puteana RWD-64-598 SS2]